MRPTKKQRDILVLLTGDKYEIITAWSTPYATSKGNPTMGHLLMSWIIEFAHCKIKGGKLATGNVYTKKISRSTLLCLIRDGYIDLKKAVKTYPNEKYMLTFGLTEWGVWEAEKYAEKMK